MEPADTEFCELLLGADLQDLSGVHRDRLMELAEEMDHPEISPSQACSPFLALFRKTSDSDAPGRDLKSALFRILVPKIQGPLEFWRDGSDGKKKCQKRFWSYLVAKDICNNDFYRRYVTDLGHEPYLAIDYKRYMEASKIKPQYMGEKKLIDVLHDYLDDDFLFQKTGHILDFFEQPGLRDEWFKQSLFDTAIRHGFDLNLPVSINTRLWGFTEVTPLAYAVIRGKIKLFINLIEHGACIDRKHLKQRSHDSYILELSEVVHEVLACSNFPSITKNAARQIGDILSAHQSARMAHTAISEIMSTLLQK